MGALFEMILEHGLAEIYIAHCKGLAGALARASQIASAAKDFDMAEALLTSGALYLEEIDRVEFELAKGAAAFAEVRLADVIDIER